jgi:hypothetical protein
MRYGLRKNGAPTLELFQTHLLVRWPTGFPLWQLDAVIQEMLSCERDFYSMPRILRRVGGSFWRRRHPLISLVGNLSYRSNIGLDRKAYADFQRQQGTRREPLAK